MISIFAQERLLGAALGSVLTGVVIFEQRKSIYKSISDSQPQNMSWFQKIMLNQQVGLRLERMSNGLVDWTNKDSSFVELRSKLRSTEVEISPREPIFGRKFRQEFAYIWNKCVDKTFEPIIQSLSSRGW